MRVKGISGPVIWNGMQPSFNITVSPSNNALLTNIHRRDIGLHRRSGGLLTWSGCVQLEGLKDLQTESYLRGICYSPVEHAQTSLEPVVMTGALRPRHSFTVYQSLEVLYCRLALIP